jgi:undecaprenyl phosphate N,N'-diacetylbacillosamine 1-phosphate transferase
MALVLLVALLPVFLVVIIALATANNGGIFFTQTRLGRHARPFLLLKFKTMLDFVDANGNPLPDLERQDRLGNFLRHYHLDELPQFVNILKGELNFIGPRPLLVEYLPYYTEEQRTRHDIKPGITGLVQVLGGNKLSWPQRMRLDVFYVKKQSFAMDWRIFWLTIQYFFKKDLKSSEKGLFSGESFIAYSNRGREY